MKVPFSNRKRCSVHTSQLGSCDAINLITNTKCNFNCPQITCSQEVTQITNNINHFISQVINDKYNYSNSHNYKQRKVYKISSFSCAEFIQQSIPLLQRQHVIEAEINTIYSRQRREVLAIAAARYFSQKYPLHLPKWMLIGTKFDNITNLNEAGVAEYTSDGDGYLKLESIEQLLISIENDPDNKDLKHWKSLVYQKIITPRSLDIFDLYLLSLQRWILLSEHPPQLIEMHNIIKHLSVKGTFPWIIATDITLGHKVSEEAKKAPIMLGSYFQDLLNDELNIRIGMYTSNLNLQDLVDHRRLMLSRGYFKSILEMKGIKDVFLPSCLIPNSMYTTTLVSRDGQVYGVSSKKAYHQSETYEGSLKKVENYPLLMKLCSTKIKDTSTLLLRFVEALYVGASCCFIWTDTPIVVQRSQWSKVAQMMDKIQPEIEDEETGYVYKYFDVHPSKLISQISDMYATAEVDVNMNSAFIKALTSKSPGSITKDVELMNLSLPPKLRSLAKSKIGLVALNSQVLSNKDEVHKFQNLPTKVFFREQKLRRPRAVAGVTTSSQLAYLPGQVVGKSLAELYDSYNTGKTTGSVIDMLPQLEASGTEGMILSFLDVAGFDSSMTKDLQSYITTQSLQKFHSYTESYPEGYFCYTDEFRKVKVYDIMGNKLYTKQMKINPMQNAARDVSQVVAKPQIDGDRYVALSNDTLSSGAFDTTNKATTVTASVGEYIKQQFKQFSPQAKASGDDFQIRFENVHNPDEELKEVQHELHSLFNSLGFGIENQTSSVFSEFLQMGALLGNVVSYGFRLSPITAERYENKHILEKLSAMFSMLQEMLGRCHYPDELIIYMHQTINLSSHIKTSPKCTDITRQKIGTSNYIKIPNIALYMKYNVPFPGLQEYDVLPSSSFTLGGDTKYLELFMLLFGFDNNRNQLFEEWYLRSEIQHVIDKRYELYKEVNIDRKAVAEALFSNGQLFNSVYNRIRSEVYDKLHIHRALIYSRVNTSLPPNDLTITPEENQFIENSARDVNTLMNEAGVNKSEQAYQKLLLDGTVSMPERLVYSRLNKFKIQDVLLSRTKDDEYWNMMMFDVDQQYTNNKKKSMRSLSNYMFEYMDITIKVEKDEINKIEDNALKIAIVTHPFTPSCVYSRDGRRTIYRRGTTNTQADKLLADLDSTGAYAYISNDIEAWRRVINTMISSPKGVEMIQYVGEAAQLSPKKIQSLTKLVNGEAAVTGGVFHITNNRKSQFWMADDPAEICNRIMLTQSQLKFGVVGRTMQAILIMYESICGSHNRDYKYTINVTEAWEVLINRKQTLRFGHKSQ